MHASDNEKYSEAIRILGEDKIKALYRILGCEKISMATLKKMLSKNNLIESLNGKKSVSKIAYENNVSRMTVYRAIKKSQKQ